MRSSVGFRGLVRVFDSLKNIIAPAYTTVRNWLLRFGCFKMHCLKYPGNNWFEIVDASIQVGTQKCLLVLGAKLEDFQENFIPSFKHVEVLAMRLVNSCTAEEVQEVLRISSEKIENPPLAIISDEEHVMKKGVRLFRKNIAETVHLIDISHKLNTCLRHELKNDKVWENFKKALQKFSLKLKQTELSYLLPPKQRSRGRLHSEKKLIDWGLSLLSYLSSEKGQILASHLKNKLTWIEEYLESLKTYKMLMEMNEKALRLVHQKGYYRGVANDYLKLVNQFYTTNTRCVSLGGRVESFLREQEESLVKGIHYLGSSEIIESLFGKFKAMERQFKSGDFTSLVLSMPALVGNFSKEIVGKALTCTSSLDVKEWVADNLGETFLSKRRRALGRGKSTVKAEIELCEFSGLESVQI
ncbi:MAG: hypothetical protein HN411_03705 [Waddliaceae bacterium]|jgi:hypothetical protein|nr:hypothetical protein [Waddliaceae bacterium]MBT3579101.1 hypothetical protein [Waddliaceae bacterium]MBT4444922.1 hypothetical protein [Waddliaceae bacterium]MBT6928479.1 hypothetical protein [Waddliaceae bacterium]MBT7264515.1 hypothetical protein [Waddliaceae bacterium]